MNITKRFSLLVGMGIWVVLQSAACLAQVGEGSGGTLDEIVITARRRAEDSQVVPVSTSTFSADQLKDIGATSTNDLQKYTPGIILNAAGTDADTTYSIRGQGKAVVGPGLPSVISYLNEVPLPSLGSIVPTAFDAKYVQNIALTDLAFGVFTGTYGPPREYGVRLRYSF